MATSALTPQQRRWVNVPPEQRRAATAVARAIQQRERNDKLIDKIAGRLPDLTESQRARLRDMLTAGSS
jgi:Spy/CpxP family protein refolding chaperone